MDYDGPCRRVETFVDPVYSEYRMLEEFDEFGTRVVPRTPGGSPRMEWFLATPPTPELEKWTPLKKME